MMVRWWWMSCLIVLGLCCAGCSAAKREGQFPTKPVSVLVTYKGSPVDGAMVTFIDEQGAAPAFGRTNAEGRSKMKTYEDGDGAVFGRHKVIISKLETNGPASADQDSAEYNPDDNRPTIVKNLVPQKYASPATSGLFVDVNSDSADEVAFELTD